MLKVRSNTNIHRVYALNQKSDANIFDILDYVFLRVYESTKMCLQDKNVIYPYKLKHRHCISDTAVVGCEVYNTRLRCCSVSKNVWTCERVCKVVQVASCVSP
jgi:hypothetical protein